MTRLFKILTLLLFLLVSTGAGAFTFKDALGREIRIDKTPQRIISLAPSITENLFIVGAGSQIVGVTSYCNYPEEAKRLPRIGDLNLNYEKILSLNPDLLIGDPALTSKSLEKLQALNLPIVAIRTQKMKDIPQTLELLGRITGHVQEADKVKSNMRAKLDEVINRSGSARRPRVFLEVWNKPLMTAGKETFLHELIEMAGGQNIAAEISKAWAQVSQEVVVQKDPEIILLLTSKKKDLLGRADWSHVSAVRNGKVFELDRDLFSQPTPRLVEALQQLVRIFNHEAP